jgi:sugar lactone lactonase YvrE
MRNFQLKKIVSAVLMVFAVGSLFTSCRKLGDPTPSPSAGPTVIVTTLAGGGIGDPSTIVSPGYGRIGSKDGPGTAASFNAPAGVAIDAAGNIYISEAGNHDIRRITPDGVVSTFAGNTTGGFFNATGTAASFSGMQGIAFDAAGNLYVADSGNQVIRKVTSAGVVTTFAGTGGTGSDNGPAASATFNSPTGVAIDAAGNFYVADFGNKMIRKITPSGIVSTLAGSGLTGYNNGAGSVASFTNPDRLAVDAAGNVYVSDFKMVRKITPDGTVSTLAGNDSDPNAYSQPVDGKGSAASFIVADGISIDAAGNLYVGDENLVRKIMPDGEVVTLAGGGNGATTDGPGNVASFGILRGLAVNSSGNLIYVADYYTSLIRKVEIK